MKVEIIAAATMHSFTDTEIFFESEKKSITFEELLLELKEKGSRLPEVILDEEENISSWIQVFVNDRNIKKDELLKSKLSDNDEIFLIPVIAGGAGKNDFSVVPEERAKEAKLSDKDIERFEKHLLLKDIGVKGQKRIKAGRVLVVGAGSLGSSILYYLSAAGVGEIGIVDRDEVALKNLQSQILYNTRDIDRPKAFAAKDVIRKINKEIVVHEMNLSVSSENAADIIADYDVVVDATDNYLTRYLLNDACILSKKPLVFAAFYQFEGVVTVYGFSDGPCLRCQYPSPPPEGITPSCAENGVLSPLPGVIGSIASAEVLKLLMGKGKVLSGRAVYFDVWNQRSRHYPVSKDDKCPLCGKHPSIFSVEEIDYQELCGIKKQEEEEEIIGVDPKELANRIERGERITLVDVREPHERAIVKFPSAVVIPIGQLKRRMDELDPSIDTIFICKEGKRSILAINTLREAGYEGPMYNLLGGMDAAKNVILAQEGAWL